MARTGTVLRRQQQQPRQAWRRVQLRQPQVKGQVLKYFFHSSCFSFPISRFPLFRLQPPRRRKLDHSSFVCVLTSPARSQAGVTPPPAPDSSARVRRRSFPRLGQCARALQWRLHAAGVPGRVQSSLPLAWREWRRAAADWREVFDLGTEPVRALELQRKADYFQWCPYVVCVRMGRAFARPMLPEKHRRERRHARTDSRSQSAPRRHFVFPVYDLHVLQSGEHGEHETRILIFPVDAFPPEKRFLEKKRRWKNPAA